jgi:hypothetical protein
MRRQIAERSASGTRDFLGLAEPPDRNVHQPALLLLVGVEELHQHLGLERPRAQRVDADVLARVHDRELTGERQHRALARRVGHLRRRRAQHRHE